MLFWKLIFAFGQPKCVWDDWRHELHVPSNAWPEIMVLDGSYVSLSKSTLTAIDRGDIAAIDMTTRNTVLHLFATGSRSVSICAMERAF